MVTKEELIEKVFKQYNDGNNGGDSHAESSYWARALI